MTGFKYAPFRGGTTTLTKGVTILSFTYGQGITKGEVFEFCVRGGGLHKVTSRGNFLGVTRFGHYGAL